MQVASYSCLAGCGCPEELTFFVEIRGIQGLNLPDSERCGLGVINAFYCSKAFSEGAIDNIEQNDTCIWQYNSKVEKSEVLITCEGDGNVLSDTRLAKG